MHLLPELARRWKGHMSVTLRLKTSRVKEGLAALDQLREQEKLLKRADIHLVVDELPNQFNLWRNIARLFCSAESVLTLDVDFLPDPNLYAYILDNWKELWKGMAKENKVYVIPAFERPPSKQKKTGKHKQKEGKEEEEETDPPPDQVIRELLEINSKEEVVQEYEEGRLEMFHKHWFHGQGYTNYTRWLTATDIYKLTSYHYKYEPYLLMPQTAPFCDERFIGYGSNKCACVFEIYMSGYSFHVLPRSFLLHRPHASSEVEDSRREAENKINMKTLRAFMDDMRLKYGEPIKKGIFIYPVVLVFLSFLLLRLSSRRKSQLSTEIKKEKKIDGVLRSEKSKNKEQRTKI